MSPVVLNRRSCHGRFESNIRAPVYHVLCRGNNRQKIFRDDLDRKRYLEKLVHYCELKEVLLLGYCLLSNHIHLLVDTPLGNLSKMMQAFQTSYTL